MAPALPSRGMQALLLLTSRYLAHFTPSLYHYQRLFGSLALLLFLLAKRRKKRSWYPVILISFLIFSITGRSLRLSALSLPIPKSRCTTLIGTLVEDSSLSRKESQLLCLSLTRAAAEKVSGEAHGVVSVLAQLSTVVPASSTVVVEGRFVEELFIATDLQILSLSRLGLLRREAFEVCTRRLSSCIEAGQAKALALLLLLGQSESESFLLKDSAAMCGCSHVLALSGMHLSFLITLSTTLCCFFIRRRWGRFVGLIGPLAFVMLAGPKPSLIRSAFVRLGCEAGLKIESAATLAYLLQLYYFPTSIHSIAAFYSWAAFLALLLSSYLPPLRGRLTALAIAATAPITLSISDSWNAAGLLFAPLAALCISAAMLVSIALFSFGPLFASPMQWITRLLIALFSLGSGKRLNFGLVGYGRYMLLLLTLFATVGYAEAAAKRRRRQHYAVGVRIRLTEGDQGALSREGVRADEEVWTKLSPHRISSSRDCPPPRSTALPESDRDWPGPRCTDDSFAAT